MNNLNNRYLKVLNLVISYYGINKEEFINLLKDKEIKYLLLLLLKECKCIDKESIMSILNYKNKRSITYNIRKAEEKLLINKEFRDKFFKIEEDLLK